MKTKDRSFNNCLRPLIRPLSRDGDLSIPPFPLEDRDAMDKMCFPVIIKSSTQLIIHNESYIDNAL